MVVPNNVGIPQFLLQRIGIIKTPWQVRHQPELGLNYTVIFFQRFVQRMIFRKRITPLDGGAGVGRL